MTNKTSIISER